MNQTIVSPEKLIPHPPLKIILECNSLNCESRFSDTKTYLAHKKWHSQPHVPGESLAYYLFRVLKEVGLISKYMTWDTWNCYEFFNWNTDTKLFETWKESIRNTCRNSPCFDCWVKSCQRTSVNRARVLGNGEGKTNYVPRSFTVTKSGMKVYDQ